MNDYYSLSNQIISGSVAGWASVTTGQPFDLMKIRFQLNKKVSMGWLKQTILNHGFFSLYKGASSVYLFSGLITSAQFAVFEAIHKLGRYIPYLNIRKGSWQQYVFSGSLVGFSSSFVITPVQYAKINTQIDKSDGKIQGSASRIFSILKRENFEGLRKLYTGHKWTLIRQTPGAGIYFGGFYILLEKISKEGRDSATLFQQLLASGLAAYMYVLFAYPFDVIKTNIQSNHKRIKDLIGQKVWRSDNFRLGFHIAVMRGVVIDMTLLPVYENCRRVIFDIQQKLY